MLPSRGSAGDAAVEAGGGVARALREEHPEVLRRGQGGRVVPTVAARKGLQFLDFDNDFVMYTQYIFGEFVYCLKQRSMICKIPILAISISKNLWGEATSILISVNTDTDV